jgi:hypothetical protein
MKQLLIPAIVCMLFILNSCRKDVPPDPKYVTIDKATSALYGEVNSRDTIYITSNDQWVITLETGVDWLSVEPMSGTGDGMIVMSTTTQNNSISRRTTNIEIKTVNGTDSHLITVTQLQFNNILLNAIFGGDGNDRLTDFTTAPGGGYIAVGSSASTQGDGSGAKGGLDIWIVKFNSQGEKVWHKKYGGTLDDAANTIVRTSSNNYIVLGSTLSSDGDVSGHKGDRDVWLLSIDGDGNLLWEKSIGGNAEEQLYNIKSSADGNYIMAGYTYSTDGDVVSNHGDADAWIVKVNGQGDIISEKTYGGSNHDAAYDVIPVSDGGNIFCGKSASIDGDASDRSSTASSAWFVKLNSSGAIGGKVYLGASDDDCGIVALEAMNGDYVFTGETNTPGEFDNFHGSNDAFVLRLSASGNVIWKKAFGGSLRDEPADLIETDDGNFIFAGLTVSEDGDITQLLGGEDAWIMKLNGDGNIISSSTVGGAGNDNVFKIKQLTNDNFAFAGLTGSFDDAYIYLPDGMHGWFQILNF